MTTVSTRADRPPRSRWTWIPAVLVVSLVITSRPSSLNGQEGGELFRFQEIEWSADRDQVTRTLEGRGYDFVDGDGEELVYTGSFLRRSATVTASFSKSDRLEKIVVVLSDETGEEQSSAFLEGVQDGIRANHGPPCDIVSGNDSQTLTWQTETDGRSSTLRVKTEDGKVSITYLGPNREPVGSC